MKVKKNLKVGDVIQFPHHEFQPFRSGWNGWIFRAGIVEKLYISKTGKECAKVRYCTRTAGRYELLPNVESTMNVLRKNCFEYDLDFYAKQIREFLEIEKTGEQVCWSEDAALLVNHGLT